VLRLTEELPESLVEALMEGDGKQSKFDVRQLLTRREQAGKWLIARLVPPKLRHLVRPAPWKLFAVCALAPMFISGTKEVLAILEHRHGCLAR
jgi:hypothetical protein